MESNLKAMISFKCARSARFLGCAFGQPIAPPEPRHQLPVILVWQPVPNFIYAVNRYFILSSSHVKEMGEEHGAIPQHAKIHHDKPKPLHDTCLPIA